MGEPILATWGGDGPVHIGRSFNGHPLEDDCPCVKAACGLVAEIDPDCEQHGTRVRTIRQVHKASECPAPTSKEETP
jgi:hypothetical protein